MRATILATLTSVAAVAVVAGCAEPVDEINRVQPHYVKKSLFEGEWYYRQTIVDTSPLLSAAFIGIEGGLEKIRWEITEDTLYAYRTHEAVIGLDEDEAREGADYKGDPVAAFRIIKHFDIRRSYNAATGEETNVIVENASDRPWYEREYMRIDWSGGVMNGPVDLGFVMVDTQRADYIRETEVFHPDQLQITDDYIQVTQTATITDGGRTCLYVYGDYNCGSADVSLRLSFAKIDPEEAAQFEPRPYADNIPLRDENGEILRTITLNVGQDTALEFACTDEFISFLDEEIAPGYFTARFDCREATYPQFDRFGFFRTERHRYDRRLGGAQDELREYYANIHNIWDKAYEIGEDGKKTPIPRSERDLRPIVYYTNVNFPEDLVETTVQISKDWNDVFMEAAMAATGKTREQIEDQLRRRHQESPEDKHAIFLVPDNDEHDGYGAEAIFQIRLNTCSKRGIEDYLRRNPSMVDVVEEAVGGVDAIEPGNIERVCAGLTRFSRQRGVQEFVWQQVGDLRFSFIDWVHEEQPGGPLGYGPSSVDPENGHIISGNAHVYGAGVDSYARYAADIVRAMNEDLALTDLISGKSYEEWLENGTTVVDMEQGLTVDAAHHEKMTRRGGGIDLEAIYGSFRLPDGSIDHAAVMRNIRRRLSNPDPRDPISDLMNGPVGEAEARLERLKQDPQIRSMLVSTDTLEIARRLHGWQAGDEVTEEMKDTAVDLAVDREAFSRRLQEKFKFFADRNVFLAEFIDDSVIGRALAMKGMPPEEVYQQLRRDIFRAVMLHEIGHTVGLTHNFEGSFDALNYQDKFWEIIEEYPDADQEAQRNRASLPEFRYSTTMDYGSRFNSDLHGLGKYDHAAIKFVYGGVVEAFAEDVPVTEDISVAAFLSGYTAIPEGLGGYENINRRINLPIEEQVEKRRKGVLRNSELLVSGMDPTEPDAGYWIDREVPYAYCFDIYRGNLTCRVFDEGATHTEAVKSAIQRYWNYYVFDAYRRGRNEYSFLTSYLSRQDRLGEFLTYPFKYYYFFQNYDIGIRNDLYQASRIGLNFINQVLGTPLPGRHCLDPETNMYIPYRFVDDEGLRERCESADAVAGGMPVGIDVPIGTGREQHIQYNDEYYYQIDNPGWYFEKQSILRWLTDTSTSFFQISNVGDSRRFSIGFYRLYREELVRLMRDLTLSVVDAGMGDAFSGLVDDEERVVPRVLVDAPIFGQDSEGMAGQPRIYSPISYNILWQGLVLSSIYNTSSADFELDFSEYLTISEAGSGEDRHYQEGLPVATFVHPRSQVVYRAAQTIDGLSIGYELLERANAFVEEEWLPAYEAIDGVRDPSPEALDRFQQADRRLSEFMELINGVRLIRAAVTY